METKKRGPKWQGGGHWRNQSENKKQNKKKILELNENGKTQRCKNLQ